jgi:hypothetical protein
MPTLHVRGPARPARAGSHRRWVTGAVIVATLLAEVPRAPDRTADRAAAGVAGVPPASDRPATAAHRHFPAPPAQRAASPDEAGTAPRPALHHLIGL